MMNLMIVCPNTGRNADTGFTMTAARLAVAPLEGNAFECGHCGEYHAWTKADLIQTKQSA